MGVRPDAPTIETIVPVTFYEIIFFSSTPYPLYPAPSPNLLRAWHLDSFTKPSGTEMAGKVPGNRWGRIPASAVFKIFLPGEEGVFFLFLPEMKKFRKIALLSKNDGLVKSRNSIEFVIPAKAGIQLFQDVLDPGFRRGDAPRNFLRNHQELQSEISARRGMGMNTVKQLERQIRDLQKELFDAKKEADLLRLQPCTGDFELRKKDEAMTEIETRVETINQNIRELEKKRREMMSTAMKNSIYESPFN
jgi:hypothetical protein